MLLKKTIVIKMLNSEKRRALEWRQEKFPVTQKSAKPLSNHKVELLLVNVIKKLGVNLHSNV